MPQTLQISVKRLPYQFRRDFSFTKHFGSVELPNLPDVFTRSNSYEIKQQYKTMFCVGFATATAAERHEGVILDPLYPIKNIQVLQGITLPYDGTDIRTGMMAGRLGFIEKSDAPYSLEKDKPEIIADPKYWDAKYDILAKKHAQASFFSIDGTYDVFDNFRSALFIHNDPQHNQDDNIVFGIRWHREWQNKPDGIIDDNYDPNGGWSLHCVDAIDWTKLNGEIYLRIQNSEGNTGAFAGAGGYWYIKRSVLNREVDQEHYGAFMFDKTAVVDEVKKKQWNFIEKLVDLVLSYWKQLHK